MEKVLLNNKYNNYMKKRVIAYLQTHWDREWYREKEEFNLRLLEVFDEVLEELKKENAPCFYFDGQTSALVDYLKFRPEKLELIKQFIKEKKLYIGPFFVSADAFLVNLRCLIKNLEKGIEYSKNLGCEDFIGYLPDIFGHSRGVFEILDKFNIKNAIIWRGTGAIKSDIKVRNINVARLIEGYFIDLLHQKVSAQNLAIQLEEFLNKIAKYSSNTLILPLGGDHLAILKNANEKIAQINKYLKNYKIELSSPFEYFSCVNFSHAKSYEGDFLDNSENNILGGVFSSRIYQKVQNTKLMHKISRIIEPLNYFLNTNYAPNIDYAYELILKNHAHDSIYGCSTDKVHKIVDSRFEKADEILKGVEKRIIRDFHKNTKKAKYVGVFNLSNYKSSGIAKVVSEYKLKNAQIVSKFKGFCDSKLYDINQVPVTEDILTLYEQIIEIDEQQPMSFKAFEPKKPEKLSFAGENFIENPYLKLSLKNGKIGVIDKLKNNIYNDFIKITDTKDLGDSYNYAPATKPEILKPLKSKVLENGTIRSVLRIFYKDLTLDVILNNKDRFFEFVAKINNKKKNHKLQAVFCLNEPVFETFAQDSLGIVKRKCDPNYSLFENQPAKRPKELKTNSFPVSNFVYTQKTGILGEGINEYEIYKNELRIALLRSTGIISNPKCASRSIPAGPPLLTPDLQCLGIQQVRFGLCFTSKKEKMFKYSEKFLNTQCAFVLDKKIDENIFFQTDKNKLFYGINNKGQGIFYNLKTDKIELANIKKI